MKLDTALLAANLADVPALVRAAEALGFAGVWTAEVANDAFLPLVLAAEHSERVELGTAIAVAFPRTPTILAHIGWDLQRYSGGRFIIGLGSQVKAHNERRLGVTWDKPVRRMRETIEAMRALWNTWQTGARLDYRGEFFKLTLMTPFFSPATMGGRLQVPPPPIYISAVNEHMLRLAGSAADGVHIHPFHTPAYLREFAWPRLREGLDRAGRTRADITASTSVFAVPTDAAKPASYYEGLARQQLAFYMSTPSYRVVLEVHGWEDTGEQLSRLARTGGWAKMASLITDAMLDELVVRGTWAELPGLIRQRYADSGDPGAVGTLGTLGTLMDRVAFYIPFVPGEDDDGWRAALAGFGQA